MSPSEMLTCIQEELRTDPTLTVAMYFDEKEEEFKVTFYSASTRTDDRGAGRRLKAALAKALGRWNGDGEIG